MLNSTTVPFPARDCTGNNERTERAGSTRPRCRGCQLAPRCLPATLAAAQVQRFEESVQRCRRLEPGEHLFRVGDPFRSIVAVHSGCFKTYTVDAEGREHVIGFHFAGEIIGIDAIDPDRHMTSCVALADSAACVLPYPALMKLAQEMPALQGQMLRMLSRFVLGISIMTGDFSAEERLAAFLVMVSARARRTNRESVDLDLPMSRQDIANYLRLAPETVSRILARFQKTGLVKTNRKHIALLDPEGLGELAACMNLYSRPG